MRFGKQNAEEGVGPDPTLQNLAARIVALISAVAGVSNTLSTIRANQTIALVDDLTAPRFADSCRISCARGQVFSQNKENGIIAEIFRSI